MRQFTDLLVASIFPKEENSMRKIFLSLPLLLAASFILTSCEQPAGNYANKPANANVNTNTSTASSSEADVKKVLTDLQTALAKNDTAALDRIYADDYTFVSPEGEMQTKAQRLESMKSGEMKFESITFDDAKVRMYGDAAVVNAKTTQKSTVKGKDNSGTATATIVFAKSKDGWRVVLGHPSATTAAKTGDTNTAAANTAANANKPAAPANK